VRDNALEGEAVGLGEPAPGGVEHQRRAGCPAGWQEHLHHGPHPERLADLGVEPPAAEFAIADSGLAACAYPLSTHDVTAAGYRQIRAQFAGSRWPDLRTAGTDYVDLAVQLLTARGTDGYQTVWFYQRLSAACTRHAR
jgi:hypothetical protein